MSERSLIDDEKMRLVSYSAKKCGKCKKRKDLREYYKLKFGRDGYDPYCISCKREIHRESFYKNIKEKLKEE